MGDSQYARRFCSPRVGMSESHMGRMRKVSCGGDLEGFVSPEMGSLAMAVDIAVEDAMLRVEVEDDMRARCRYVEKGRTKNKEKGKESDLRCLLFATHRLFSVRSTC